MSCFKDHARKLYEMNLSIVPVDGITKACFYKDWSKFSKELPSEDVFDEWETKQPNDGIGLICGEASGVLAVDFDYTGSDAALIESAILGILPPSPIGKKGGKGWTYFYKWSKLSGPRAINKADNQKRVVDIIDNRLTVLPPTPHKNGNNYTWITPYTLLDLDTVELHEITDQMLFAIEDICKSRDRELLKPREGRHDKLFGFHLHASRTAKNFDEYKKMIFHKDSVFHKHHPKGPYFQDPKVIKHMSPEEFLTKEANRWYQSYKKYLKSKKNEELVFIDEIPEERDTESERYFAHKYEHYMSGFHYTYEDESGDTRNGIDYYGFAKFLHEKYNLIINDAYTYIYKGNHYEELIDKNLVDAMIVKYTKEQVRPSNMANFSRLLKAIDPRFLDPVPSGFINLKNGIMDVRSSQLLEHTPDYNFTYVLDTEYIEGEECPEWLKFLDQILLGDQELVNIVQEMFGYVLIGGNPFLHKAFVLSGEGRNGKSTLLDILKKLIGKTNYSSVPMSLLDKPFSVVQMNGKLANIVGELSTSSVSSEFFKTVVSGEPLNMARKGKDEYSQEINARLIFATNTLPAFKDTTTGIYEKLCIIPFDYYIPEDERDTSIGEKLSNELSGILNWSLEGAVRILNTRRLTRSERTTESLNEWRNEMDIVYRFVQECIEFKDDEKMDNGIIYLHYENFCEENNFHVQPKPWMMRKFYEILRKGRNDTRRFKSNSKVFTHGIALKNKVVQRLSTI